MESVSIFLQEAAVILFHLIAFLVYIVVTLGTLGLAVAFLLLSVDYRIHKIKSKTAIFFFYLLATPMYTLIGILLLMGFIELLELPLGGV